MGNKIIFYINHHLKDRLDIEFTAYYIYYIDKTAYSLSNVAKQQKLNVINYKHEYMR